MIHQLLHRYFVFDQMKQLMDSPEQGAQTQRRSLDPVPDGNLTQEDYDDARAALIEASRRGC
ncbi:MAG: hypothetical protein M3272_03550 [Actinomycetota bacterium]|nr:hypothetical protein [Actinomycetota bacterium]